jgi:hypothetical protein
MTDKGAHWFRCDLQVHIPRDRNWQGADRIADEDREAYICIARMLTVLRLSQIAPSLAVCGALAVRAPQQLQHTLR